jgi:putative toxin-antitoxin system antitoxin component (TIGR02293 family)
MIAAEVLTKYKSAISSDLSIVKNANAGIDSTIFSELIEISGINKTFLAEEVFDVSLKTMLRYQKEGKKLTPRNSEIALKLLNFFDKGIEIFGSMDSFMTWLNKRAYGLGNEVPLTLMNTNTGIDLIEEELIRIEFGALA